MGKEVKVLVLSANLGSYDLVREPKLPKGWRFYCFEAQHVDNAKAARHAKIMALELFPVFDRIIWIDANLEYLGDWNDLNKPGFTVMKHNLRNCAYDEAGACVMKHKDDPENIGKAVELMRLARFPFNYGLHATGFMCRDNTPEIRDFCAKWWKNLEKGSHRDQLSFDLTRFQTGMQVNAIPFLSNFRKHKHLK